MLKGASYGEERWRAAEEVRKMTKEDPIARITMAMLGAIPPLISMLDAEADPKQQCAALLALLNLAIGNET
jgi:TPP-dependent pyruvate/acetoin dehydrogenase alpha subunit